MELEFQRAEDILVVRVQGELDMEVADGFRDHLERALERNRSKHLILNLQQVSFIDSSGLGVILGRYKRLAEQGGVLAISEATSTVRRLLEMSGIESLIEIHEGDKEAMGAVKKGEKDR